MQQELQLSIALFLSVFVSSRQCFEVFWSPEIEILNNTRNEFELRCKWRIQDGLIHNSSLDFLRRNGDETGFTRLNETRPIEDTVNWSLLTKVLTFTELDKTQEGIYTCNATAAHVSISTQFNLQLKSDRHLEAKPLYEINERGGDAVWQISGKNLNITDIDINSTQWQRTVRYNATLDLLKERSPRHQVEFSGTIILATISKVDFEDVGAYRLVFKSSTLDSDFYVDIRLSTDFGTETETESSVLGKLMLNNERYKSNDSVRALCKKPANSTIQWYFKESSSRYVTASTTFVKIPDAHIGNVTDGNDLFEEWNGTVSRSGLIACAIEEAAKVKDSSFNYVCISEIDSPIQLEGPTIASEKESVKLTCRIDGCELLETQSLAWYFIPDGGSEIEQIPKEAVETKINSKTWTLVIDSFTETMSGVYYCQYTTQRYILRESINIGLSTESYIAGVDSRHVWISLPLILIIMAAAMFLWYRQRKNKLEEDSFVRFFQYYDDGQLLAEYNSQLSTEAELLPVDNRWAFPKENLKLGERLGAGFFGEVFRADALGICQGEEQTTVAVKMVKHRADPDVTRSLIKEFKIMAHIGRHEFVVRFLGAVVSRKEFSLIVEYCHYGCLLKYLQDERHRFDNNGKNSYENTNKPNKPDDYASVVGVHNMPLNPGILIGWSYQISRGMQWLASKKVLHGDLAARNILLTNKNIIKISDFGLASDLYANCEYQKSANLKLPIKWMAMESIKERIFSSQSDVWSFGVTIWEIFSLGTTPYPEFEDVRDVWKELQKGNRMEKPQFASTEIYDLMLKCWNESPMSRPTFEETSEKLSGMLEDSLKGMYLRLEEMSEVTGNYYVSYTDVAI